MNDDDRNGIQHLCVLFGNASRLAEATGIHRSGIHYLQSGKWALSDEKRLKILMAAAAEGLALDEVVHSLNIQRCDCCGEIVNGELRDAVDQVYHTAKALEVARAAS